MLGRLEMLQQYPVRPRMRRRPYIGWSKGVIDTAVPVCDSVQWMCVKGGIAGRVIPLRCCVDASYLAHVIRESQWIWNVFRPSWVVIREVETLIVTSSTYAKMQASYSLVVDITYVLFLCTNYIVGLKFHVILESTRDCCDIFDGWMR